MKFIRLLFLMLCAVVSIAAQTTLRPGEFLTTRDPNFSPDGKYIVFSAYLNRSNPDALGGKMVADGNNYEIRVYDIGQKSWSKVVGKP